MVLSKLRLIFFLFLFLCLALVYAPTVNGPYFLDDSHTIESNVAIHSYQNFFKLWTSGSYYSSSPATWGYRPLTTLSNLVLWNISDGETWSFRIFKIVLFFFICCLAASLWQALLPEVSEVVLLAGLLLFALNPVHTQLVSYIAATSSLLATIFGLIAILFYLKFRDTNKSWLLALSSFSLLLATLAKEEGVVAVGLIVLTELYLQKKQNGAWSLRGLMPTLWPALAGSLGVFLIFYFYEPTQGIARGSVATWPYFMTQWRAYLRYILSFVWAYDLNADNSSFGFSKSFFEPAVLLALALNLGLLLFAGLRFKQQPLYLFVLLWFYASVAPTSSIIPLAEPVNDHRALTASLALALPMVVFLSWIYRENQKAFAIVVLIVAAIYGTQTFQRSLVWGDRIAILEDTVEKNPRSGRAQNNLAIALMSKAEWQRALYFIEDCLRVAPNYSYCHVNKAIILANLGEDQKANDSFAKAVPLDLQKLSSRLHWAKYLMSRGNLSKAKELLQEADAFAAGKNFQVRLELIKALSAMGQGKEADGLRQEARAMFGGQSL